VSFDQFRGSACLRGVEVACLYELEIKKVESASLSSTLIVQVQILSEMVIKISFRDYLLT
jgi:hypothetical protein